jgi:hypothetical protein
MLVPNRNADHIIGKLPAEQLHQQILIDNRHFLKHFYILRIALEYVINQLHAFVDQIGFHALGTLIFCTPRYLPDSFNITRSVSMPMPSMLFRILLQVFITIVLNEIFLKIQKLCIG